MGSAIESPATGYLRIETYHGRHRRQGDFAGVRTCFDIDENDEYLAARELLVRRCRVWASEPVDAALLAAALDSRHYSADGRLTYWTPQDVRRFLQEWAPRHFRGGEDKLETASRTLRALLRFIDAHGLRDPRGSPRADNDAAIDAAVETWVNETSGLRQPYPAQPSDVADLEAARRQRTLAQLPVQLPGMDVLEESAAGSTATRRLRSLSQWLGRDGKALDDGKLSPAQAQELAVELQSIGDGPDPSATGAIAEAKRERLADLYVAWAKRMRLVRSHRGRLVTVAKAEPLLRQPLELWRRAFDVLPMLDDVVCRRPTRRQTSMVHAVYPEMVPDVLNSLYSLPAAMPVKRMEETVWWHCCADWDEAGVDVDGRKRRAVDLDLSRVWDVLTQLGALEWSFEEPDPMFRDDLNSEDARRPFAEQVCARLGEELSGRCRLMRLSDVATWVIRERMLDEGREAGLLGELAESDAGEMLSVVTQHYTAGAAAKEVAGWMSAHDAGVETLLDEARSSAFRCRAASILDLLHDVSGDSGKLLRRMRSDPTLAPSALVSLVETGTLELLDLTEPERQLLTAESSLRLMELDGPEAVVAGLDELSGAEVRTIVEKILASGHPDVRGLEEFRILVARPLTYNGAVRHGKPPPQPTVENGRLGATRRARTRRRGG